MLGKKEQKTKNEEVQEAQEEKKEIVVEQYEIGQLVDIAKVTKFIGARGPDLQVLFKNSFLKAENENNIYSQETLENIDQTSKLSEIATESQKPDFLLFSSVLPLRGTPTKQPLLSAQSSNILLFNGEIFANSQVNPNLQTAFNCSDSQNDGEALLYTLDQLSMNRGELSKAEYITQVVKYMGSQFPESDMSFVFIDRLNDLTFIHRDLYGKRSLCMQVNEVTGELLLSSTMLAPIEDCEQMLSFELEANTTMVIDWQAEPEDVFAVFRHSEQGIRPKTLRFKDQKEEEQKKQAEEITEEQLLELRGLMVNSVQKRIKNIPFDAEHNAVAVMFSGGLDSTLLACILAEILPPEIGLDLVNVSFQAESSADRFTSIFSLHELLKLHPGRKIQMLCADYDLVKDILTTEQEAYLRELIAPKGSHMDFNIGCALHYASKCEGYLFDTAFYETEEFLKLKAANKKPLQIARTGSKPVPYDQGLITNKIKTVATHKYRTDKWIKSNSKVVFMGQGADEIFAGYSRHRNAQRLYGLKALQDEISFDLERLWHRNMGRDDRVISANAKEARFPYLDTALQQWLRENSSLSCLIRQDLNRGSGEKFLLRRLAREHFKLLVGSSFEKRSIQFGSKIAKQTNVLAFGSNRKANGRVKAKWNNQKLMKVSQTWQQYSDNSRMVRIGPPPSFDQLPQQQKFWARQSIFDCAFNITDRRYEGNYGSFKGHKGDLDVVLKKARDFGVQKFVFPSKNIEDCQKNLEYCLKIPNSYTTIGLNTTFLWEMIVRTQKNDKNDITCQLEAVDKYFKKIEQMIQSDQKQDKKIVAIGECSLEEGQDSDQTTIKCEVFKRHFDLAKKYNLPMYFNAHNAGKQFFTILKENRQKFGSGVVHCFKGKLLNLMDLIHLGLHISVSGDCLRTEQTCRNVQCIPLDLLLIESNSPFHEIKRGDFCFQHIKTILPKVKIQDYDPSKHEAMLPFRNEPCSVVQVVEAVAALKNIEYGEIVCATHENTLRCLGLKDSLNSSKQQSMFVRLSHRFESLPWAQEENQFGALNNIAKHQIILFGEHEHSNLQVIALLKQIAERHLQLKQGIKLNIVMEHFNFEMQFAIDEFMNEKLTFDQLMEECDMIDIGLSATNKLYAYRDFLQFIRQNKERVNLHAGVIPAHYVQDAIERGRPALHAARRRDYLKKDEDCEGSEDHYSAFVSVLNETPFEDDPMANPPEDSHRKPFAAKVIRDCSIAHKVNRILDPEGDNVRVKDSVMVVCAYEHIAFGFGVPQRIQDHDYTKAFRESFFMACSRQLDGKIAFKQTQKGKVRDFKDELTALYGDCGKKTPPPADLLFLCEPKIVDKGKPSAAAKDLLQQLKQKDNLKDDSAVTFLPFKPPEINDLPTFELNKERKPGNSGEGVLKLSTESLLKGFEEYEGQNASNKQCGDCSCMSAGMGLKKYNQKPYLGKKPLKDDRPKRMITEENYLRMYERNTMDDPIPEEDPEFKGLNPNKPDDIVGQRDKLPWLRDPNSTISCWELIKQCVSSGKDLFRLTMPVNFNEPLSILQKAAQQTEYNFLLDKAAEEPDSLKRLALVVAHRVSSLTHCERSNTKPFNPLLGETYELKTPDMEFLAEQVSHHPPISAIYTKGKNYQEFYNSQQKVKLSATGNLRLHQVYRHYITLEICRFPEITKSRTPERYEIIPPVPSVHNLLSTPYVDIGNRMTVLNLETGEYAQIDFQRRGWFTSQDSYYKFEGKIYSPAEQKGKIKIETSCDGGTPEYNVSGKWSESLSVQKLDNNGNNNDQLETLWTKAEYPEKHAEMYGFSRFSLQLNYLTEKLKSQIPQTDSRWRPDQRALEDGDFQLAKEFKNMLEMKQRCVRKARQKYGEKHKPVYFKEWENPRDGKTYWIYNNKYFEHDRKYQDWSKLQDIFGANMAPKAAEFLDPKTYGTTRDAYMSSWKLEPGQQEIKVGQTIEFTTGEGPATLDK